MALGTDTSASGGAIGASRFPSVGDDEWSLMSGISPTSPLVGGTPGTPGYGDTAFANVVTTPNTAAAIAQGTARNHWSGAFNFRSNPLSWLLLIALALWAGHKLDRKR
jgi:hypothetical protein